MSIPDVDVLPNDAQATPTSARSAPNAEFAPESSPGKAITEIASEIENTSLVDPIEEIPKSTTKLCGVCNEKESKYKCSRCYLPYCSVSCSTIHKSTHPLDEALLPPPPQVIPQPKAPTARAGTVGFKGPFAVLDDSKELQQLFIQFPNLPKQLDLINAATLRPIEDFGQSQYGGKKQQPWNQDKGTQLGVEALKRARIAYGKDGEGVREYGKLILQLLARESEIDAKELIQRELDNESTQIIRQLLEMER